MNKVFKAASYLAAPKLTFAANNPKKAAFMKAGTWAANRIMPGRRKPSFGSMALKGFGAAAVAAPIGFWIGQKILRNRASKPTA